MNDDDLIFGGDFFDLEEELPSPMDKLQLREGELREVAVLFADIKGFSSISNLFDAETIHKKMDEIMKLFSRCITYYGGFVDKYMGDGIMALFGAKEASEQDTERALMAGLKMHQQLKLYNSMLRKQPGFETLELGLRIGINTGLVSVGKIGEDREGDFTVYGPMVNLASRMESNAPVNKIMVPLNTKKMVERNFDFEPLGYKTVKGFDDPIECFTVLGTKQDSSLHRRNHNSRYIGRKKELGILQNTLDTFSAEGFGLIPVVGIRGEAGLGKTRLVYEFELANEHQAFFLHGASSTVSPSPLNLFSSLLETLFRMQISENPATKLQKLESGYATICEGATETIRAELLDAKPLIAFLLEIKQADPRLKQSGTALLNHLSKAIELVLNQMIFKAIRENKPLVLILDDLHWIDEASSKVLENLVNKIANAPDKIQVLFLLMYRLEYRLPPYIDKIAALHEIELKALSAADIRALIVDHTKGLKLPEETIAKVTELSEGNPFFLEEWCNYIEDIPLAELKDFPVPVNLHSLILSRLDKLPPTLRMLLHKASVIGQEFFVDILKSIEQRLHDPLDVDATLNTLEQQSLIFKLLGFDYSTYFFRHITTREVAYQTLLAENRKTLHQLCGEAIEEIYAGRLDEFSFVLAEHFSKAEITDKASFYLEKAASNAALIYNNQQAMMLYRQMLKTPGLDESKRLKIRFRIADIQWLIGDWKVAVPEVEHLLAEAIAQGDKELCFDAYRFLGIAAFYKGDMDEAFKLLQQCSLLAEELSDPLLSCIATSNLSNWFYQQKQFDQAKDLQMSSLELATKLHDAQRQAKSLSNLGLIALETEDAAQAEQYFKESLNLALKNRLRKEESIALGNLRYTKMLLEDYDSALPLLQAKLYLAEDMNDKLELIKVLENISNIWLEKNDIPAAITCYQRIYAGRLYLGDETGAARILEEIGRLQSL